MKSYQGLGGNGPGRTLRPRTLVILAIVILASGWTLFSTFDFQFRLDRITPLSSDNKKQSSHQQDTIHSSSLPTSDIENTLEPAVSFLDPKTKYISYMPFAGLTNQFIALEVAAFAAKQLNRTLIIPPIISNTHDHENTHQRWSQFLDIPRFTELTGIQVLEWDSVRPLSPVQRQVGKDQALLGGVRGKDAETDAWRRVAENVTCQIIYGYGAPDLDINISARNFVWHFLFRPVFVRPPPKKPETPEYDRTKIATDNRHKEDLVVMDDLVARYRDYDDVADGLNKQEGSQRHQILFLSNTFKIKDPFHENRYWREAGRHMHFLPQLMEYATMQVNQVVAADKGIEIVPNDDPEEDESKTAMHPTEADSEERKRQEEHQRQQQEEEVTHTSNITAPQSRVPHIAVHLRRGDIGKKCSEQDQASCLLPFSMYEEAVDRARVVALKAGVTSHLPVIVTTDSDSEDDFQKIRKLGWHRLDHEKSGTKKTWGSFGPAMVDAGILAHADVFIGSGKSTMTRIAAARQKAWYHRDTLYPQTKAKMRKTGLARRMVDKGEETFDEDVRTFY
ncbi:hypothetical protein BGX28_000770 [Mortierella sp. GBA30]|nr:hypothetical protein BGX28_000770 [Mortierella sp. GBA30]